MRKKYSIPDLQISVLNLIDVLSGSGYTMDENGQYFEDFFEPL